MTEIDDSNKIVKRLSRSNRKPRCDHHVYRARSRRIFNEDKLPNIAKATHNLSLGRKAWIKSTIRRPQTPRQKRTLNGRKMHDGRCAH